MSWGLITEMGHVAIRTSDLDQSIWDATNLLGLRLTEKTDDVAYLAASDKHHELIYTEHEQGGVDLFGLVARDGDALKQMRQRIEDENLQIISDKPTFAGVEDGFSFIGPEGYGFEIYIGMQKNEAELLSFGPDRYGHINYHPQDTNSMKDFLTRVLDFRVSDDIGGQAYFLRCNSDHHGIAILPGDGKFHHHAWQAQSAQDLTKLGDRLHKVGRELIWGPVRHGAGHNIACYYVETSGAVVELYTDLEQIYDDSRPPIEWGAEDNWYNMWSPRRPLDFRDFGIQPVAKR